MSRKSLLVSCLLVAAMLAGILAQAQAPAPKHPRGARPSPRHKAFAVPRHQAGPIPATFGVIPTQISMWGNDRFGDCVSAEEAFAKDCYATMAGGPPVFIPEQTVVTWARQHGFLNGADLTSVMDAMARSGMTSGSITYSDGPYQAVNWTDDATLSSAIYTGPVKIAVAADQLENVPNIGNANGWVATGFKPDNNTDHCVSLCGFGTTSALCTMLGVQVPSGADPSSRAYLLFTWNSIGVIDQPSMVAITSEAWLRTPTTPQGPQPKPLPSPAPTPSPSPAPAPAPTPAPATITVPAGTYSTPGFQLAPAASKKAA
jgi:hypothetical protein